MKQEARQLRRIVGQIEQDLERAKQELKQYEDSCLHDFKVTYEPVYHKAHTIPGDKPGTMGSDWRGSCYVPAKTEDQWKRECEKCGLVQITKSYDSKKSEEREPR